MRFLLILLTAVSLQAAQPATILHHGSESTFTHTLKPLTTAPAWRAALGITNGASGATNITVNNLTVTTNITVNNLFATNIYSETFITTNVISTNITVNNLTVVTNITVAGTNVPTINPTDEYLPVRTGTNSFGDSPIIRLSTNSVGVDEILAYTIGATNMQPGGVVVTYAPDGVLTNLPAGVGALRNDGANNLIWADIGTINPTDTYIPVRQSETNFIDSPLFVSSAQTLVYTNGSNSLSISTNSSGQIRFIADNSSTGFVLWNGGLVPLGGTTMDLSGPSWSDPWQDLGLSGDLMIQGFKSGVNYSRLMVSHSGTNGVILFSSQAAGTAGAPRPLAFNMSTIHTNIETLAYAATVDVNPIQTSNYKTLALTGDVTITTSGKTAGTWFTLFIDADGSTRNLTFPAWNFMNSAAPTTLAANKTASLTVFFRDTTDANAIANYAVEP